MNSPLSRDDLFFILRILKPLRQACCHYQIGNHWMSPQQHVMSLAEIQSNLEETIQMDCEGAWRDLIATRNAICGLLILQGNRRQAIENYKQTLEYCKEQKEKNRIDTDHLQIIHCLHNLVEMNQIELVLSSDEMEQAHEDEEIERAKYVSRANDTLMKTVQEKKIGMEWINRFISFFQIIDNCCHSLAPSTMLWDDQYTIESIAKEMKLGWHPSLRGVISYHELESLPKLLKVCKMIQSSSYGNTSIPSRKRKSSNIMELQKSINVLNSCSLSPRLLLNSLSMLLIWLLLEWRTYGNSSFNGLFVFYSFVITFVRL